MKLNRETRTTFIRAVLADVTDDGKTEALQKTMLAFAVDKLPRAFRDLWGASTQQGGRGWFHTAQITLYASEDGTYATAKNYYTYASTQVPMSVFADNTEYKPAALLQDERVYAAFVEWRDWYLAKQELEQRLSAVVEQCTTTEKLLKALPELEQYIPVGKAPLTEGVPQTNAVAVLLSKLGVPPETAHTS